MVIPKYHSILCLGWLLFYAGVQTVSAATIGYWRMENNASDSASNPVNGTANGGVAYSSTALPGPYIYDPISGTTVANTYSFNASAASAALTLTDNAKFDQGAFTWEFFIRLDGQPDSWDAFLRRRNASNLGYQIDFTGGDSSSFGNIRSRWDTSNVAPVSPATSSPGYNKSASGSSIYADNDGYGTAFKSNNGTSWHHIAMTFDGINKVQMYTDYVLNGTLTIDGPAFDTTVLGNILLGKAGGNGAYGLFMDEVRFSSGVLTTSDFLRAVPEPSRALLLLGGIMSLCFYRRR